MNTTQLRALTDEGLTLKDEIAVRETRLKEIEKTLKSYAEANPTKHVPLKDEEREGTRLLITGSSRIVPVVFTSDLLRQSLAEDAPDLPHIRALAGDHFAAFYKRTVSFEACQVKAGKFDGKAFRANARLCLEQPEEFIAACVRKNKDGIPVSQSKVAWDEAEEAAAKP